MKFEFVRDETFVSICRKIILLVIKKFFHRVEKIFCTCANFHLINSSLKLSNLNALRFEVTHLALHVGGCALHA